jgi:TRAP-type C4-dicarboxylate transport system permease small subunit
MLRAYEALTRVFRAGAACCVIAMIVVLIAGITLRELFGLALVWGNEVSLVLFVWSVFLGTGVALAENLHIRFGLAVERLPLSGRRTIGLLVSYVGLVLLLGLFLTGLYVAYVYRDHRFTTIVASALWQWLAVPTGMLLAILGWIRHGKWTWRGSELQEKAATGIPGL